ncbi:MULTISPECIES: branched-chain amino acid ABC transporter permease [Limnochorda]|uniref:branched-chain amino acid ABC transporter permease n=1 Tax=Limnochorda TaxID=1676651 RepID=UPI0018528EA2|nr:branched-chain amino acid ABC transporter permease [Limnochorda pilosa]NMA71087.1 branched-chain amino acid ABC transporter permease [Bacillota bacterium]
MPWEELTPSLFQGILMGSLFVLMAVGLTLTYAVSRVINFAHGELVTLGAYAAALAVNLSGLSLLPALVLGAAAGALAALTLDELIYKPLMARRASPLYLLVASIGASIILRHLIYLAADAGGWLNIKARVMVDLVGFVGYAAVTSLHLQVVPAALGLSLLLHLFLTRSRTGKAMRALAENPDLARASAIPVARLRRLAWLIAGAMAGLGGGFWAVYANIQPALGALLFLRLAAASILGGLTNVYATILGGYVVGLGENVGITLANAWAGVPLEFRTLITFAMVVLVLLFRPSGLGDLFTPGRSRRWI